MTKHKTNDEPVEKVKYKTREEVLIDLLFEECKGILEKKGRDYTRGSNDIFDNFKKSAEFLGITPKQAFGVHLYKQLSAILAYLKTGKVESESIKSRVVDTINYMTLLYLFVESEAEAAKCEKR